MRTTLKRLAVIAPVALLLTLVGVAPAYAAPTTITGQADPTTATLGTALTVSDTATLTGAAGVPTGTVTFGLFDNNDCADPPLVGGPGTTITAVGPSAPNSGTSTFSTSWTPPTAGTFYWQASYAGDANNNPAETSCIAATQQVVVAKATPTLSGEADPQEAMEGVEVTLTDTATLAGAHNPTGEIYFALFDNEDCFGDPVIEDTAPISGNTATLTVSDVTPVGAGPYFWFVAYEGDANNMGVEGDCDDPEQLLMVALNPDNEPQEPGPLAPIRDTGDGEVTIQQLPATGPAPVLELLLLGLGMILVGTSAVGFGRGTRAVKA